MPNSRPVTVVQLDRLKNHVTRELSYCKDGLGRETQSVHLLEHCASTVMKQFIRYQEAFLEYEIEQRDDGEEYDIMSANYCEVENEVRQSYSQIQERISTLNAQNHQVLTQPSMTPKALTLALPPIEIPNFSGERRDWPAFWQTFEALIDSQSDIEPVIKFAYLKKALVGEAARQIRGFSGTSDDYTSALELLKQFYDDKEAIRQDLIDQFLALKPPKCSKEELIHFHTTYSTILRQLNHYVTDISQCAWMLDGILQRKLPSAFTKFLYDRYHSNYFTEPQITQGILDFTKRDNIPFFPESTENLITPTVSQVDTQKVLSIPSIAVQNIAVTKKCVFCTAQHPSRHCNQYSTISARRTQLEALGRCNHCLAYDHQSLVCKTTAFRPCITCQKTDHHGFLCLRLQAQPTEMNTTSIPNIEPASSTSFSVPVMGPLENLQNPEDDLSNPESPRAVYDHTFASSGTAPPTEVDTSNARVSLPSSAVLPTAIVTVQGTQRGATLPTQSRCFFDQGSQMTFISKSLQARLGLKPVAKVNLRVNHGFNESMIEDDYDVVRILITLGRRKKRMLAVVSPALTSIIHSPGLVEIANDLRQNNVPLADDYKSDTISGIEILIGADHYGAFVQGLTNHCGVNLIQTSSGYMIYGPLPSNPSSMVHDIQFRNITVSDFQVSTKSPSLPPPWNSESLGIHLPKSARQNRAIYHSPPNNEVHFDNYCVRQWHHKRRTRRKFDVDEPHPLRTHRRQGIINVQ